MKLLLLLLSSTNSKLKFSLIYIVEHFRIVDPVEETAPTSAHRAEWIQLDNLHLAVRRMQYIKREAIPSNWSCISCRTCIDPLCR
jgi:hypothetical protein